MPDQSPPARKRPPRSSAHAVRYPDRLHAHLAAAVEAHERIEALPAAEPGAPTPASLVERYGGSEAVKTSQNEGGENAK